MAAKETAKEAKLTKERAEESNKDDYWRIWSLLNNLLRKARSHSARKKQI